LGAGSKGDSVVRLEAGLGSGTSAPGAAPRAILNRAADTAALLLVEDAACIRLAHMSTVIHVPLYD